jgi:tetrahydromethanopterin S-methyltransferase subunit F
VTSLQRMMLEESPSLFARERKLTPGSVVNQVAGTALLFVKTLPLREVSRLIKAGGTLFDGLP